MYMYAKRRQHTPGFTFGSVFEMLQMCVAQSAQRRGSFTSNAEGKKRQHQPVLFGSDIKSHTAHRERKMNAPAAAGQLKRRASAQQGVINLLLLIPLRAHARKQLSISTYFAQAQASNRGLNNNK
jgi:hypothetical protein